MISINPAWLDRRAAGPMVAMTNGLLDIASRELISHSPFYFNTTAVPFDYDPDARRRNDGSAFLASYGRTTSPPSMRWANGSAMSSAAGSTCTRFC